MGWPAARDRILARLREPVLDRPLPEPKEQKSFAGIQVGQGLRRGDDSPTYEVIRCTNQFAELRELDSSVNPTVPEMVLQLNDRDWKANGWVKVRRSAKRRTKEGNNGKA